MQPNHQLRIGEIVTIHSDEWLERQRIAGKITAGIIYLLGKMIEQGTEKTLLELDNIAREYIFDHQCEPTFYQYHGFPGNACWSVNEELVHGIPSNRVLTPGDLVTVDLGATYKNAIADSACTFIAHNQPRSDSHVKLITATKEALDKGIVAAKAGNQVGEIGYAIYKSARANGFEVIVPYGGHGIGEGKPHLPPFVANKAQPTDGIRLQAGMTIAIEPLLTTGSTETTIKEDKWTVTTSNLNSHQEHTIFIHNDRVEILTLREEETI